MQNNNNPDISRVYDTPGDVETLIGAGWNTVHNGTIGTTDNDIDSQMLVMGLESYSGLANFNMGSRSAIPRVPLSNQPNNQAQSGNQHDWNDLLHGARSEVTAIQAFRTPGFSTGDAGGDTRDIAFAHFVLGVSMGDLALVYDSVSIVSPNDSTPVPPLVGYDSAMTFALSELDTAIAIASKPGLPALPAAWLNASSGFTSMSDFVQLAHSFKARFRAMVARTPAERAKVNWAAVIADAKAGITKDYDINLDGIAWDIANFGNHYRFDTWHSMPTPIIGMADTSGAYSAWLATPFGDRQEFLIETPDKRFPSGATRAAQNASSPPTPDLDTGPYFKNRPVGDDRPVATWAASEYDYYRFQKLYDDGDIGPFPFMTKAEIHLLQAEGDIRTGNMAEAAALIDSSRIAKGGLPSLVAAGVTNLTTPVPGSDGVPGHSGCVPQVPQPPNFTSAACGNLMEALKWEKRMEDAYTGYGMWYFDGRGWGDLPEGTPLEWPVPFEEMQVRQQPFYDLGGIGGKEAAAKSDYGW
ncbi:MAG TPA: hypothetical protein VFW98_03645 [Gemmatimonadaceae bacterium]|nr:hypothetical protein [Gemmatimonadaceae bacterium]